ncbi:MAG: pitrilysin family protein [Calditrichia bacterium]
MELLQIKTTLPNFELEELNNGCKLYTMNCKTLPLIEGAVNVYLGGSSDPISQAGRTAFMAAMLKKGTGSRTMEQIDRELDYYGYHLSGNTLSQRIMFSFGGLATYLNNITEIQRDIFTDPIFPEEEMAPMLDKRIASLKRRLDDPSRLASGALMQFLFSHKYYGFPVSGTLTSLSKLKRNDIISSYKQDFLSAPKSFFLVGDFSKDQLKYFKGQLSVLAEKSKPIKKEHTPVFKNQKRIIIVDKPDASQIQIRAAIHSIPHHHEDFYPLMLGTMVLGGNFSSRLMQIIRVEKGYSYGAYTGLTSLSANHSIFTFSTFTRVENIQDVIQIFMDEKNRLASEPVDEAELIMNKNYFSGQYPLSFEQYHDLLDKLIKIDALKFTQQEIEQYPEQIRSISGDRILSCWGKHMTTDDFTFVLVGPADDIKQHLSDENRAISTVIPAIRIIDPELPKE